MRFRQTPQFWQRIVSLMNANPAIQSSQTLAQLSQAMLHRPPQRSFHRTMSTTSQTSQSNHSISTSHRTLLTPTVLTQSRRTLADKRPEGFHHNPFVLDVGGPKAPTYRKLGNDSSQPPSQIPHPVVEQPQPQQVVQNAAAEPLKPPQPTPIRPLTPPKPAAPPLTQPSQSSHPQPAKQPTQSIPEPTPKPTNSIPEPTKLAPPKPVDAPKPTHATISAEPVQKPVDKVIEQTKPAPKIEPAVAPKPAPTAPKVEPTPAPKPTPAAAKVEPAPAAPKVEPTPAAPKVEPTPAAPKPTDSNALKEAPKVPEQAKAHAKEVPAQAPKVTEPVKTPPIAAAGVKEAPQATTASPPPQVSPPSSSTKSTTSPSQTPAQDSKVKPTTPPPTSQPQSPPLPPKSKGIKFPIPKVRTIVSIGFILWITALLTDDFDKNTISELQKGDKQFLLGQFGRAYKRGTIHLRRFADETWNRLSAPPPEPKKSKRAEMAVEEKEKGEIGIDLNNNNNNNQQPPADGNAHTPTPPVSGEVEKDPMERIKMFLDTGIAHSSMALAHVTNAFASFGEKVQDWKADYEKKQVAKAQAEKDRLQAETDKIRLENEQRAQAEKRRHEQLVAEREQRENERRLREEAQKKQDEEYQQHLIDLAAAAELESQHRSAALIDTFNQLDHAEIDQARQEHVLEFLQEERTTDLARQESILPLIQDERQREFETDLARQEHVLDYIHEQRTNDYQNDTQLPQSEPDHGDSRPVLGQDVQSNNSDATDEQTAPPETELIVEDFVVVQDTTPADTTVVVAVVAVPIDPVIQSVNDEQLVHEEPQILSPLEESEILIVVEEKPPQPIVPELEYEYIPLPVLPEPEASKVSTQMLKIAQHNDELQSENFLPDLDGDLKTLHNPLPIQDISAKQFEPEEIARKEAERQEAERVRLEQEAKAEAQRLEREEEEKARVEAQRRYEQSSPRMLGNIVIDVEPERRDWMPSEELKHRVEAVEQFTLPADLEAQLHRITSLITSFDARQEWTQAHDTAAKQSAEILEQAELEMKQLSTTLHEKLTKYQIQREELLDDLHYKLSKYELGSERLVNVLEHNDYYFFQECRELIVSYTQSVLNAAIASTRIANEKQATEYAKRLEAEVKNVHDTISESFQLRTDHAMGQLRKDLESQHNLDIFQLTLQHAKDVDMLQEQYSNVLDKMVDKVENLATAITAQQRHTEQVEQIQRITLALFETERLLSRGASLAGPINTLKDIAKYDQALDNIISTIPEDVIEKGVAPIYHIQREYAAIEGQAHRAVYVPPQATTLARAAAFMFGFFTSKSHSLSSIPPVEEQDDQNYPTSISEDVVNDAFFRYLHADQQRLRRAGYYFDRGLLSSALDELKVIKNPNVLATVQPVVVKIRDRLAMDQTLQVLKSHGSALNKDIEKAQI